MTEANTAETPSCHCTCPECERIRLEEAAELNTKQMATDDVDIITAFFKALSAPTRFNIVYTLLHNPKLSVNDIAQITGMSMSAVSHQLAILRMRNLVKVQRVGVKSYYMLCDDHVYQVVKTAIEHVKE